MTKQYWARGFVTSIRLIIWSQDVFSC